MRRLKMIVSVEFYSKSFSNIDRKEAYRKLTNWLAKHIVTNKDENRESTFKIEELKGELIPTFKLTVYCSLETKDEENKFCEVCKTYHKSFFINQEYNCNACKHKAFIQRMDEKLSIKKGYRREKLARKIKLSKQNKA